MCPSRGGKIRRTADLDSMTTYCHAVFMRRTQIQIDDPTYSALRQRAFAARKSISAVVREALASALAPARQGGTTPPLAFIGMGRSRQLAGRPVSVHHDEALAEAFDHTPRKSRRR